MDRVGRPLVDPTPEFLELFLVEVVIQRVRLDLAVILDGRQLATTSGL
jgi:hypothetical protein